MSFLGSTDIYVQIFEVYEEQKILDEHLENTLRIATIYKIDSSKNFVEALGLLRNKNS